LELDVVEVELSRVGGLCLNGRKSRETVADVEAVDDVVVPRAAALAEEQLAELEVVEVAVNDEDVWMKCLKHHQPRMG
jgi:hypothetical protein